jgi:antitoxin (DNA-binding transcriptional repressor) of toxin-antitoxin stability system
VKTISFCEARTHFSELLDQVAKGKKILITRRGKPAALLSLPPAEPKKDVRLVVKEMLEYRDREGPTLGGISVRELIEEGRRF